MEDMPQFDVQFLVSEQGKAQLQAYIQEQQTESPHNVSFSGLFFLDKLTELNRNTPELWKSMLRLIDLKLTRCTNVVPLSLDAHVSQQKTPSTSSKITELQPQPLFSFSTSPEPPHPHVLKRSATRLIPPSTQKKNQKLVKCSHCNSMLTPAQTQVHTAIVHRDKLIYQCLHCGKLFDLPIRLHRHESLCKFFKYREDENTLRLSWLNLFKTQSETTLKRYYSTDFINAQRKQYDIPQESSPDFEETKRKYSSTYNKILECTEKTAQNPSTLQGKVVLSLLKDGLKKRLLKGAQSDGVHPIQQATQLNSECLN